MLIAALVGFVYGFVGSIPIAGPIAALVVSRGLDGRYRAGVWLALGAAIAEGIYALLSFFGLSILLDEAPWVEPVAKGIAALILGVVGVVLLRAKSDAPATPRDETAPATAFKNLFMGLTVSGLNPTLIVTASAGVTVLFAAGVPPGIPEGITWAVCTGIGSTVWFAILMYVMHRLRKRFDVRILVGVRRVFGVVLLGLALWFGYQFGSYLLA